MTQRLQGTQPGGRNAALYALPSTVVLALVAFALACFWFMAPGHVWGGDYAHYFMHAANILDGRPYDETIHMRITGPVHPMMTDRGPAQYPPVYPLVLTPLFALFGPDLMVAKLTNILFGGLSGVLLYLLACRVVSREMAIYATCLFLFTPYVLFYADIAGSEHLYVFLSMLVFFFITKRDEAQTKAGIWTYSALIGGAMVLAYEAKTVGIALVLALVVGDILRPRAAFLSRLLPALGVFAIGFLAFRMALPASDGYSHTISGATPFTVLRNGVQYTAGSMTLYGLPRLSTDPATVKLLKGILGLPMMVLFCTAVAALALRALTRWNRSNGPIATIWAYGKLFSVQHIYVTGYLVVICLMPFVHPGRLLMLILPILILTMVQGLSLLPHLLPLSRLAVERTLQVFIVFGLITALAGSFLDRGERTNEPAAAATFEYVATQLPDTAIVAFAKARMLSWHTGQTAVAVLKDHARYEDLDFYAKLGVSHFMTARPGSRLYRSDLQKLIDDHPRVFGLPVFETPRYRVYRLNWQAFSWSRRAQNLFTKHPFTKRTPVPTLAAATNRPHS